LPATLALTAQVATAQWVEVGYSVTQNFGLISSVTSQPKPPFGVQKIQALVVVSNNEALVESVRDFMNFDHSKEALLDRFKEYSFRAREFGKNGIILVDLDAPYLQQIRENTHLFKVLKNALDDNFVLRLSNLNETDRAVARKHFGVSDVFSERSPMTPEEIVMGLDVRMEMTIRGPWGERRATVSPPHKTFDARNAVLLNNVWRKYQPTQREIDEIIAIGKKRYADHNQLRIHFVRRTGQSIAKCMTAVAELFEELESEWRTAEITAGRELLKRFPVVWSTDEKDFKPSGETNLDSLPADIRSRLEQSFVASWRVHGFNGEDEARQFLLNSGSITMGTRLATIVCWQKGTPESPPPLFYVHVLGLIP